MEHVVRLGVAVVTSPLEVGADQAPALLEQLANAWTQTGFAPLETVVAPNPILDPDSAVQVGRLFYEARVDAICVIAASWYEDYLVLDMLEECRVPVIGWAYPGMETGSLCGMQQLGMILKQLGHPYCFVFDTIDSLPALERAWDFARAAAVRNQLRRARIGYLGHRVEGMTETTVHELALKRILGPRVVGLDTQVFLDRAAAAPVEPARDLWKYVAARVGQVMVDDVVGIESTRVYAAMRETIEEQGLAAVAVGCYPHLMGKVCLAASLLAREGVPIGCEGDVNGTVGMLILTRLMGTSVHNTDLLDPIPEDDTLVFSHCDSGGFDLAEGEADITLGPVRLMDRGLCCLFTARPGPVTMLNLVPTLSGYRLAIASGEAVATEMVFPGNPLRVRFPSGYRGMLHWIAREGLGHHWMAVYGDCTRALGDLATLVGCECLSLD